MMVAVVMQMIELFFGSVRRLRLAVNVLDEFVVSATLVVDVEIRANAYRRVRILIDQQGRDISIAHKWQAERFDAVIDVHPASYRLHDIGGHVFLWVEVSPGELAD
jgi:hypothetical protein